MSKIDEFLNMEKNVTDTSINKKIDKVLEKKTKVDVEPENPFTPEKRKKLRLRLAKGENRKERKRILLGETNPLLDKQRLFLFIAAAALFVLTILFTQFPQGQQNEAVRTIILLVGIMMFLPVGIIVGWLILDPVMRCKIARKMTHKNFGLIYFIAKGGKVFPRMKNLDNDIMFIKNKAWAITKAGIYEIDPDGERISDGDKLDPEGVITISETVPIMFIDMKSIEPLVFDTDDREKIAPEELSSFLKGWTDNQLAKIMFLRKTLDIYFIIVIACSIASAFLGYQNYNTMEELRLEIEQLKQLVTNMIIPFINL